MTTIDFDKPKLCPHCNEPMKVRLPIWVTPGEDVDTGNIGWEECFETRSDNWWCETCQSHHFPVGHEPEPRFDKTYCSQCGGEFGPGEHGYSHCADHQGKG